MGKYTHIPSPRSIAFLAACFLFSGSYFQLPLFSSNQNTYFLNGLARAGYGNLSFDWLANQTDHIPLFSIMVSLVHSYGSHWIFYALFFVLASVYAASLTFIAAHLDEKTWRTDQVTIFFVLLTLLHCSWIVNFFMGGVVHDSLGLLPLFSNGVAGQYILGQYLQPSAFGVLLVTSVACFINKKEFTAIFCAVLAATIHPTYIIHAAVLTVSYMLVLLTEKHTGKALWVGATAALLILPTILYIAVFFHPSNPLLLSKAQTILVEERIPHHAKVSVWFSIEVYIQLALILAGIAACYRRKRLFKIIALCAAISICLTCLQVITGNTSLALLFPWRISTWLIPISTAILIGYLTNTISRSIDEFTPLRFVQVVRLNIIFLAFVLLVGVSFLGTKKTISAALVQPHDEVVSYAKENSSVGQAYLVPLDYENFRLAAGLPVFVDWKSHPYRDIEVIEWHDRVGLTKAFYQAKNADDATAALASIQERSVVTHVILNTGNEYLLEAFHLEPIFRDRNHILVKLKN